MFAFEALKSCCQINLPIEENPPNSLSDGHNKWSKVHKESYTEPHKILASAKYTFAACHKSLVVHDCRKVVDRSFIHEFEPRIHSKEAILNYHDSIISCMSYDETSGLLCTCSDDAVFLVRWDSLLCQWDKIRVSEGDGRILSCSVTFNENVIFVGIFKSDTVIVYQGVSVHPPTEPGPLILESIECLADLEKTKDNSSHSRLFFISEVLYIVGVSSGNAVSVKLWELQYKQDKIIKLVTHRTVRNIKTIAAFEIEEKNAETFMIVMSHDGYAEVFIIEPEGFVLLNCIKVEDPKLLEDPMNASLSSSASFQSEFCILSVKFYFPVWDDCKTLHQFPEEDNLDSLSSGEPNQALLLPVLPDLDNTLVNPSPKSRNICPNLMAIVATNKRISFMNVKSGGTELMVGYEELLKDDSIIIHTAKLAVDNLKSEIVVALQPCLARVVFCRRFTLVPITDFDTPTCSLISQEILSAKSVLRKRIRSPPPQASLPASKGFLPYRPKNLPNKPSWAKSRSRPNPNPTKAVTNTASNPLISARSHPTAPAHMQFKVLNPNDESLPAKPVRIEVKGSYDDEELKFREPQRINLETRMSNGLSTMRLATNKDGKLLAIGANVSPLMIMKTQPFETIRLLKDIAKVTSLNFSFNSNLLLLASNSGTTTMVHWKDKKELLSFDFNSKFNEHIHSQFYFMDKFILQPEENRLVLYSYAKRDSGYIKLQAGSFALPCQSITSVAAVNQFYSNQVIAGLSNKSIQVFDTNAEKVGISIPQAHSKAISCIRVNEAPRGTHATELCDFFLTSCFSSFDPVKLWDLRNAKCVLRISDINSSAFVPTTRPALSPCGRYIASGFEDNSLVLYDVRKINSRVLTFKGIKSSVLDCCFDMNFPMIWCGCRNGSLWNFYTQG